MNSTWLAEHVPAFVTVPTQLSLYCRRLSDSEPWLYQDRIMPSASLIKLPIMSALFRQEKEGALTLEERCTVTESVEGGSFYGRDGAVVALQELVFHMIVESDNTCANLLIERLGLDTIQAEIDRLGLVHTKICRKMMDFEAAAAGRENLTCAADMGCFFSLLANGQCVDPRRDKAMRDILSRQEDNCILPAQLPHTVRVDHKTGELDGIYHDCGLIYAPGGPFILCLLARHVANEPKLFYELSYFTRALYDELQKK